MLLVDAHCHINSSSLEEVEDNFNIVSKLICGGVSPEEWQSQIDLQKKFQGKVFTSFGLHPWRVAQKSKQELDSDFEKLEGMISQSNLIGETGLDAHGKWNSSLKTQIHYFRRHIELANAAQKPLVIHAVKALPQLIKTLKEAKTSYGGMIHSFHGSATDASELMNLGFYVSLGPSILKNPPLALHNISLSHLLLESDAPDQAMNSRILLDIAEIVAKSHKIESDTVIQANYDNFHKLLGVSHGMDADSHWTSSD